MTLALRPYRPEDREACLALFDSNVPRFFAPAEQADFAAFLEAGPGDYFVAADGGEIVSCGGVFVKNGAGSVGGWSTARDTVPASAARCSISV